MEAMLVKILILQGYLPNFVWNYQGFCVDISRYLIKLFYCPDFLR